MKNPQQVYTDLQTKIIKYDTKFNNLEQNLRRNCLCITGIPESPREYTGSDILTLDKEKLAMGFIKFTNYNTRSIVMKKLKKKIKFIKYSNSWKPYNQ